MNTGLTKKETRHLRIFFIVTLLWTWIVGMVPMLLGIRDTPLGNYIFVFTAGIAPSCVGVIMVLKTYTKEARRDYFRRFIPTWRGAWFILVYAVLLITLMTSMLILMFWEYPNFVTIRGFLSNPCLYWVLSSSSSTFMVLQMRSSGGVGTPSTRCW